MTATGHTAINREQSIPYTKYFSKAKGSSHAIHNTWPIYWLLEALCKNTNFFQTALFALSFTNFQNFVFFNHYVNVTAHNCAILFSTALLLRSVRNCYESYQPRGGPQHSLLKKVWPWLLIDQQSSVMTMTTKIDQQSSILNATPYDVPPTRCNLRKMPATPKITACRAWRPAVLLIAAWPELIKVFTFYEPVLVRSGS